MYIFFWLSYVGGGVHTDGHLPRWFAYFELWHVYKQSCGRYHFRSYITYLKAFSESETCWLLEGYTVRDSPRSWSDCPLRDEGIGTSNCIQCGHSSNISHNSRN